MTPDRGRVEAGSTAKLLPGRLLAVELMSAGVLLHFSIKPVATPIADKMPQFAPGQESLYQATARNSVGVVVFTFWAGYCLFFRRRD